MIRMTYTTPYLQYGISGNTRGHYADIHEQIQTGCLSQTRRNLSVHTATTTPLPTDRARVRLLNWQSAVSYRDKALRLA